MPFSVLFSRAIYNPVMDTPTVIKVILPNGWVAYTGTFQPQDISMRIGPTGHLHINDLALCVLPPYSIEVANGS